MNFISLSNVEYQKISTNISFVMKLNKSLTISHDIVHHSDKQFQVHCSFSSNILKYFPFFLHTDFFSQKGQECLIDNVITIGYCYLSAMPDSIHEKQEMLFNLMEGKECKYGYYSFNSHLNVDHIKLISST